MWISDDGAKTVSIVIAALNEAATIGKVLAEIKKLNIADTIILVDDASTDSTPLIAESAGCRIIKNDSRRGQTRSLRIGINASTSDLVITMDADMDHFPSDIPKLLQTMDKNKADLVIGCRSMLPRISEKIMSAIVSQVTGISDTISGFRLLSRRVLEQVEFDDDDTWGSIFLIRCAKKKFKIAEVVVKTPQTRTITRTGGKFRSNMRILRALYKDVMCMAGII